MSLASLLCALTLVLAAQSAQVGRDATSDWERVLPGLELSFPRDHGSHPRQRIEWWYLTGQLEAEDGRQFGYQFTVFRSGLSPRPRDAGASPLRARQVLAGHLAITDVAGGRTLFAERLRRTGTPLARAAEHDLDLALEDWSLVRGATDELELRAGDAATGIALELQLAPAKPLVLHGQGGYSSKGSDPGNASAYVSWTRLATLGRLSVGGERFAVNGASWFDHEYGSSVLEEGVVGWDWFGLQMEDGRELMLFLLRGEDGAAAPASAGTLVARDGSARALGRGDFVIEALDTWTSPRSEARYPARWSVSIPSADLRFEVRPLVPDCELSSTRSTDVCYWEGPVLLERDGRDLGRGYAELTGYAGSMEGRF